MQDKQKYGQFMTKNFSYILQNMNPPREGTPIVEPFAGNGDLLNFLPDRTLYPLECYDINPKHNYIEKRDTLLTPPNYFGKFILTNPPYLARNKTKNKKYFDKYGVNDLYKCFIKELIQVDTLGGILIVPLNFWSSIRKADIHLRREFLEKYQVIQLNIFEERVFEDTSYTICSFQYEAVFQNLTTTQIHADVYPSCIHLDFTLNKENNYLIGGRIYSLSTTAQYKVSRATRHNSDQLNTKIVVKCIDDSLCRRIQMTIEDKPYIDITPNLSARTYASLIIVPTINIKQQQKLMKSFNNFLENERETFNSLFLTNYRESKDMARKRISFDLIYKIVEHLLENNFKVVFPSVL